MDSNPLFNIILGTVKDFSIFLILYVCVCVCVARAYSVNTFIKYYIVDIILFFFEENLKIITVRTPTLQLKDFFHFILHFLWRVKEKLKLKIL